jgi:hypothetical protein
VQVELPPFLRKLRTWLRQAQVFAFSPTKGEKARVVAPRLHRGRSHAIGYLQGLLRMLEFYRK